MAATSVSCAAPVQRLVIIIVACTQSEGVSHQRSLTNATPATPLLRTLICFVLKHRVSAAHAFCSRYDLGPWPLLRRHLPETLHDDVLDLFRHTRTLMMNGCVFDELPADVVAEVAAVARSAGAAVIFDPGAAAELHHSPLPGSTKLSHLAPPRSKFQ